MSEPVSVTREIAASPEQLYAMVSGLERMGEWSPENEGGEWLRAGATFRGNNRNGKKSWKTLATIVDAEPGRRFSFRVTAGPIKVAQWSYDFEPVPTGCRVTESWVDQRPRWFRPIAGRATGVTDRATHNRQGMEQTLDRLAASAEGAAT
jgi:uncharacterized protein YndB with AHSA1/START domain